MYLPTSDFWVSCIYSSASDHARSVSQLRVTDSDTIIVPVWILFEVTSKLSPTLQGTFLRIIHSTQNIRIFYPDQTDLKRIQTLLERSKGKNYNECATKYVQDQLACTLLDLG